MKNQESRESSLCNNAGSETAQSQQRREELSPLHTEIERRFGLLPNFFRLAPESPEITANLWGFARFAYLDNPLPSLFKERLFVYLSRFCEVRYCITRHVGFLVGLGHPSGDAQSPIQTVEDVIRLIRRPLARAEQLEPYLAQCAADDGSMSELPAPDSRLEEAIFACASHVFLQTPEAAVCLDALQRVLGESRLQHLLLFLGFVRTAHYWTKTHQELAFEADLTQLLATHQSLAEYLLNDPVAGACEVSQALMHERTLLRETEKQHCDLLRAHQALRESEARFREMIDALPAAIYTTDAEGRLTHFNPAAVEFSGRVPKLGSDEWCVSWKLYRPDGTPMPHDECPMAIALKEGRAVREAGAIVERPDGTRVWFMPYPTPFRDAQGKIVGGINMLVDITERKRAELANARLVAIVEFSDDAIVSKDLNGVITSWNAGAERLFGYHAQEAIGRPITMLIPPERLDEEPGILERIRGGESIQHYETVRRRKDGTLLDISLTVSPILDSQGRVTGASKIARDITDRKQAEERLKHFAVELEQRVAERTYELAQSEDHLRTLATELNLAEQRERKRLATELHDHLQQMLVLGRLTIGQGKRATAGVLACEQVLKKVDDIFSDALTYSRTLVSDLSPTVLRDHGLTAVLQWLGTYMKKYNQIVTVTVPSGEDLKLPEDQVTLLFQSVRELLINSSKHAGTGQATVRMEQRDGLLRIEVQDEGAGFDLAAAAAAAAGTPTGSISSKFGLFSIRERMRAVGGSFQIESAPGKGTRAMLTLPAGEVRGKGLGEKGEEALTNVTSEGLGVRGSDDSEYTSPLTSHPSRVRVLLVDDHPTMRQGLRSIVTAYDHLEVVGEASNGAEAVELAQGLDPDVVVMDINMPKMDGIEATQQIKANQPTTVIIGLSVNQSADTEKKMKAAGVSTYLTKESAVDALCHAIEHSVSSKRKWKKAALTVD